MNSASSVGHQNAIARITVIVPAILATLPKDIAMRDSSLTRLFPANRIKARGQSGIQGRDSDADTPRRTTHGSHAWSLPSRFQTLRQPQDGAIGNPIEGQETSASPKSVNMLREPEDAYLSGTMRSLARRVLGLNVTAVHKTSQAFNQQERYFAEPNLPKLLKNPQRKGPDGTRLIDTTLTRPQVA
jgi:hypothetical protein